MFGINVFKKYDNCTLIIKDNPSIYGKNNILNEVIKMQYKTESAKVIYIDDNLNDIEMGNLYKLSNVLYIHIELKDLLCTFKKPWLVDVYL